MATIDEIKQAQRAIGTDPDGRFGPKSVDALVRFLREFDFIPPPTKAGGRAAVVAAARGELGAGGAAKVQDPDKYWRVVCPALVGSTAAWCGGFALWCLREAGVCDWPWIVGKGFASRLRTVSLPERGDIAYFANLQHHAIVVDVGGGLVTTVDGNQTNETVALRTRRIVDVTAFYSIGQLVGGSVGA